MKYAGNATVSTYLGNRLVGQSLVYCCGCRTSGGLSTSGYWPHTAYFCPACGDIWKREVYLYEFDYQPIPTDQWAVQRKPCLKHGDWFLFEQPLEGLDEPTMKLIFNGLLAHYQGVKES